MALTAAEKHAALAAESQARRARAADAIDSTLAQAEQLFAVDGPYADRMGTYEGWQGMKAAILGFQDVLGNADRLLEERLTREIANHGGPDARFTGAAAMAYQRQVRLLSQYVTQRLAGQTREAAMAAMQVGYNSCVTSLSSLEAAYSGISSPLRINSALVMENALAPTRSSLLQRSATSVDRYGEKMIREYERTVQTGLVMGASQEEMVQALVGQGGPTGVVSMRAVEMPDGTVQRLRLEHIPEGLFRRHRFWAERIIRTEVANAQNAGNQAAMVAAKKDFPDLQRKILAMQDDRTAPDSHSVHGQIRDMDKPFVDGAGRVYMHPPARPNDREVMIPWRPTYDENAATAPEPANLTASALIAGAPGQEVSPGGQAALAASIEQQQAANVTTPSPVALTEQAEATKRFEVARDALAAMDGPWGDGQEFITGEPSTGQGLSLFDEDGYGSQSIAIFTKSPKESYPIQLTTIPDELDGGWTAFRPSGDATENFHTAEEALLQMLKWRLAEDQANPGMQPQALPGYVTSVLNGLDTPYVAGADPATAAPTGAAPVASGGPALSSSLEAAQVAADALQAQQMAALLGIGIEDVHAPSEPQFAGGTESDHEVARNALHDMGFNVQTDPDDIAEGHFVEFTVTKTVQTGNAAFEDRDEVERVIVHPVEGGWQARRPYLMEGAPMVFATPEEAILQTIRWKLQKGPSAGGFGHSQNAVQGVIQAINEQTSHPDSDTAFAGLPSPGYRSPGQIARSEMTQVIQGEHGTTRLEGDGFQLTGYERQRLATLQSEAHSILEELWDTDSPSGGTYKPRFRTQHLDGRGVIDGYFRHLEDRDMTKFHKRWLDAWTSDSSGARSHVARVLRPDASYEDILAWASDIGIHPEGGHVWIDSERLEFPAVTPAELVRQARAYIEHHYAATQAALELSGVPEEIVLYRGVQGRQGRELTKIAERGEEARLLVWSASSWSESQISAAEFATEEGAAVVRVVFPRERIWTCHRFETGFDAWPEELEWIPLVTEESIVVQPGDVFPLHLAVGDPDDGPSPGKAQQDFQGGDF